VHWLPEGITLWVHVHEAKVVGDFWSSDYVEERLRDIAAELRFELE
jgi:hypothetical protein